MLIKRVKVAIIDTKGLEPFADLIKEIYGDVAKPGVTQVGIALATVIGLLNTCLSPIKFLNEKTELNRQKNLEKLAERFSEIPADQVIEAPSEIAVPIAEKLVYVSNEELRNLYIELLAKASTNDLCSSAHPSFVNIINSLSPDEAIILEHLYTNKKTAIPCIEVRLHDSKRSSSTRLTPYYSEYDNNSELTFNENASAYISNLIGLGILQHSDMVLRRKNVYEELEKKLNDELETAKSKLDEAELKYFMKNKEPRYKKMQVFITPFGELFLKAIMSYRVDITEETP